MIKIYGIKLAIDHWCKMTSFYGVCLTTEQLYDLLYGQYGLSPSTLSFAQYVQQRQVQHPLDLVYALKSEFWATMHERMTEDQMIDDGDVQWDCIVTSNHGSVYPNVYLGITNQVLGAELFRNDSYWSGFMTYVLETVTPQWYVFE